MSRIAKFLENHKPLWVPSVVAIVAMWIFAGTIGFFGHFAGMAETTSKGGEAGLNILTVILGICALSFLIMAVMMLKASCDEGDKLGAPDLTLTGIMMVIISPIISMLICGIGLFSPFVIATFLIGHSDYLPVDDDPAVKLLMTDPGITFMAAGIILGSYFTLGVFLEIICLPFRCIKKRFADTRKKLEPWRRR